MVKSGRGLVTRGCSELRANLWLGVSSLRGHVFSGYVWKVRFFNIVYSAARLALTFVTCLAAGLSSVLYWSLHVNRT